MFSTEETECVELLEPCVICYDSEDATGSLPVKSSLFLQTNLCRCKYMVHNSCMMHWLAARPRTPSYDFMYCLVCSSPVERKRTIMERVSDWCRMSDNAKRRVCRYTVYTGGAVLIAFFAFGGKP